MGRTHKCSVSIVQGWSQIIHRDLKPSNILVTDSGQVRLLDFGIARLLEAAETDQPALTSVYGRALTPDYASPELLRGDSIDERSDLPARSEKRGNPLSLDTVSVRGQPITRARGRNGTLKPFRSIRAPILGARHIRFEIFYALFGVRRHAAVLVHWPYRARFRLQSGLI
jgi:serine/threonine protein kinase